MRRLLMGSLVSMMTLAVTPTVALAQTEDVVWTSLVGVSATGNSLTKTAATAWNADAVSLQAIESNGFVEFTATETNKDRVCGLSKGNSSQAYADIDFAIYLTGMNAYVYQGGSYMGASVAFVSGDRFRVEVAAGVVRYRKNGVVFYTSAAYPQFPLLVDTAFYTNGATLTDVKIGYTSFTGAVGVSVSNRTLTKTGGTAGWNAGAISGQKIYWADGFAEFTATETNTRRAGGLSTGDSGQDVSDIDYAIMLNADATVEIKEAGTSRGSFGSYAASDRFRVEVEAGTVRYFGNGSLLYTSGVAPTYPLNADTAFDTVGSTLTDVVVGDLVWTDGSGVVISGASLRKNGGTSGWNAGAISTATLESGDGFVEFTAIETNTSRMCGLGYSDSGYGDSDIEFAVQLTSAGEVKIVESGTLRGTFGSYASGDRFRVEVQTGTVKYRKNGAVFYTSGVAPIYALAVDTSLDTDGATLNEVTLGNFVWRNDVGVVVRGYGLNGTASTGWGSSGAVSTLELQSGDGFVEFPATETTTYRMVGLSKGDSNQSYTDIDFAIYPAAGTIYVYEGGTSRGTFGTFSTGDRLRVAVEGGVVKYRRNGTLLYTSTVTPQYPLLIDSAFYTNASTIAEIALQGTLGPPQVATPAFSPAGGTYASAQSVTITCATGGATIRYTTDGSEPTTSSTTYTGAFSVGTTTTVKAKAWKTGLPTSDTAPVTYTMNFGTLAAPSISPAPGSYTSSVSVTMSAAAGTIRYTTDGSDPTGSSTFYTGAVSVVTTSTVKAKAFHPDYVTSATTTNAYTILVATPTFTSDAGAYAAGQAITVATTTAGATLRYTLNGVDPTTSDPVIASGATLIVGNYTLKATAWKTGGTTSGVKSAAYTTTGSLSAGAASGGSSHVVVAQSDGAVSAFGNGSYVPVRVSTLTGITAVAAGVGFSVAQRVDGLVWTWGVNGYGQLGDNTNQPKSTPLQVGISGVVSIAAGEIHVVAAKSDGSVWAWGYNGYGQLGDGTTTDRWTPTQVTGLTNVIRVAAGVYHSLALKSDGTVWAWGYNAAGQLGDGSTTNRSTPVRVDGLSSITALTAGMAAHFSAALRDDGAVWAWGAAGSIGDGTNVPRLMPVRVSALSGVTSIRAGGFHTLALKSDGTVWAWGTNSSGPLGDGTTTSRLAPVPVPGLTAIAAVGAGSQQSLAIDSNGSVWSWGLNSGGQLGDGTTIMRLSPTRIAENGFAWKVGTPTVSHFTFTYSTDLSVTVSEATVGATIHYTTNGNEPTEADPVVTSGGTVSVTQSLTLRAKAWKAGMPASNTVAETYTLKTVTPGASPGGGSYGSAQSVTLSCTTTGATIRYTTDGTEPTGSSTAYSSPIAISVTTTLKAKAFKSGWSASDTLSHTYTLTLGTLAAPSFNPTPGPFVTSVSVTISGPGGATLRYTTDGADPSASSALYSSALELTATTTLKAKAFNPSYNPSATTTGVYTIKVPAPGLSPGAGAYSVGQLVTASAAGGVAVRYTVNGADPTASDGVFPASGVVLVATTTIKARGFKAGCSDSDVTSAAYTVTGSLPGDGVTAGGSHSGARSSSGNVWTWGLNASGQLGDGTNTTRRQPVAVSIASVTGFDAGENHTVAQKSDGTAWAWGSNWNGQIGDATTTQRTSPVQVSSLGSASAIAAGSAHSVAAKSDGTAWAWGLNSSGQLGDNSTTQRTSPVQVSGLSGVSAVAAGYAHSLALESDGTVWAWGSNSYGQLGDGSTTQRLTPVQVSGLTGVVAVEAGYYHSLALKSDGTVWSWGHNSYGQLGDGTATQRTTPVQAANLTGARTIGAGFYHSLAAKTDGSAWTWGYDSNGQLGGGTSGGSRTSPGAVVGLVGVVALAGGSGHSLALDKEGAVWGWGYNWNGELGDGTEATRLLPVKLSTSSLAWNVATPTLSPAGGSSYYAAVIVTLSCPTSGAAIHYTTNGSDPTTSDPSVTSGGTVNVGESLTLKARAFKSGSSPSNIALESYVLNVVAPAASLTYGTYATPLSVTLSTTTSGATIRYTTDATAVTETSPVYTSAINVDQSTYIRAKAWKTGWTTSAELYVNYTLKVATPGLSPGGGAYGSAQTVTVTTVTPGATLHYTTTGLDPTESDPVVASGATVTVVKSATLRVRGWRGGGWTPSDTTVASFTINQGTVATPTFAPAAGTYGTAQVLTLASTTPGATIRHTVDGTDPTWTSAVALGPVTVDWTTTVKAKAFKPDWTPSAVASAAYTINLTNTAAPALHNPPAGSYPTTQTVALTTSTSGATIHYTTNGNDPTTSDTGVSSGGTVTVDRSLSLKARVFKAGMTASPVRRADYAITGAIAAAWQHGFGLKVDGTLWGWGVNGNGQVGDGTTTTVTSPVQVLSAVRGVSAAGDPYRGHSLVVKADGTVWGWGENGSGQLGDGTTTQRLTPVQTSGLTSIITVSAGDFHSLALTSDGQVYAWGYNYYGQLGDGTTTQRLTPIQVPGLSGVTAVAAGWGHSLALKSDGSVWAWGYNYHGQVGDGTTTDRTSPVQVASLSGVTAIAVGDSHSLALRTEGSTSGEVWAWGLNANGQIGDGTTLSRTVPVRVLDGVLAINGQGTQSLYLRTSVLGRSIWGSGNHQGSWLSYYFLGGTSPLTSVLPVFIASGPYVRLAPGTNFSIALRADTTIVLWGGSAATFSAANALALGSSSGTDDPDQDGLTTAQEWLLGTDPWNPDTNGDGIRDGVAIASGMSATNPDMDGDGVSNAVEVSQGTDPFNADTDGDTYSDSADCFPLDPSRWNCPSPSGGDTTPPVITLTEPTNATLLSVVPPL